MSTATRATGTVLPSGLVAHQQPDIASEAPPASTEAPPSPARRPPTPGKSVTTPAAVDLFSKGIHRVEVPPRTAPPARLSVPSDQLRSSEVQIPGSAVTSQQDPHSLQRPDRTPPAELPAVFLSLTSLANVPAQQWEP